MHKPCTKSVFPIPLIYNDSDGKKKSLTQRHNLLTIGLSNGYLEFCKIMVVVKLIPLSRRGRGNWDGFKQKLTCFQSSVL